MPRSRRFAAVAVLAVLGALALTGCGKAQPDTAAYVGGTRYTERQVDELVDDMQRSRPDTRPARPRQAILTYLVLRDLGRRAATERGITVPEADNDTAARVLGLPAGSKLVRLRAEHAAVDAVLHETVEVTPTEADYRAIWAELRTDPLLPEGVTYEAAVEFLRGIPTLPTWLGVRNALRDQAEKTKVVINPVYGALSYNFGSRGAPVSIRFGDDGGLVSDLASG